MCESGFVKFNVSANHFIGYPGMDTHDIVGGEDWKLTLKKAIRDSSFFVACLSNNSVRKRGVIQEELKEAFEVWRQKLEDDIYFIPVRLEECEVPESMSRFQWLDMFEDDGLRKLSMAIQEGLKRYEVSQTLDKFNDVNEVRRMLKNKNLFDCALNSRGKGATHEYQLTLGGGKKLVIDGSTSLTWQQSGSRVFRNYVYDGKTYVSRLNQENYAGYRDWRLPTLEEAMSLMEPEIKNDNLYLNPIFDKKQSRIWTAGTGELLTQS